MYSWYKSLLSQRIWIYDSNPKNKNCVQIKNHFVSYTCNYTFFFLMKKSQHSSILCFFLIDMLRRSKLLQLPFDVFPRSDDVSELSFNWRNRYLIKIKKFEFQILFTGRICYSQTFYYKFCCYRWSWIRDLNYWRGFSSQLAYMKAFFKEGS